MRLIKFFLFVYGLSWLLPGLSRHKIIDIDLSKRLIPPSFDYWFGTDPFGNDLFSIICVAVKTSLHVSFTVLIVTLMIGASLGFLSGWAKGWVEEILTRIFDVFQSIPSLLVTLSVLVFMGAGTGNIIFALSLTNWIGFARIVRGEVILVKNRDYFMAAISLGVPLYRLFLFHFLPGLLPVIAVQMGTAMASFILAEASLSFLGVGMPATTPSLGSLVFQGKHYIYDAPHLCLAPGLVLFLLIFGFYYFSRTNLRQSFVDNG